MVTMVMVGWQVNTASGGETVNYFGGEFRVASGGENVNYLAVVANGYHLEVIYVCVCL